MALKFGTNNSETIGGTPYDDVIFALGGNDKLYGYGGDDQLLGQDGNDFLVGGSGADFLDGGSGTDKASYYGSPAGITINLMTGTASGGDAEGDTLQSIEEVIGTDHDDFIVGNDDDNFIVGHAGNDTINGGKGNDYLMGAAGTDILKGGGGTDRLFGGDDNDLLNGGGDSDLLDGGGGNDRLTGSVGDDRLLGGAGSDTLNGGSGADTFEIELLGGGSDSIPSNPDHIEDFKTLLDRIAMPTDGTSQNYFEAAIGDVGYLAAKNWVESHVNAEYVFVTDGVNGYLFASVYDQGTIDTGIVLEGLTSVNDFHYSDIVYSPLLW